MARVENLIASHNSYQILGVGDVDNIMRPARDHVDCFYFVSGHFKFYQLTGINISLLDQAMAMNHNELLPFGIVPVLAFRNTRFADIDGNLTTVCRMYQLYKASSVIAVHFHRIIPDEWCKSPRNIYL